MVHEDTCTNPKTVSNGDEIKTGPVFIACFKSFSLTQIGLAKYIYI